MPQKSFVAKLEKVNSDVWDYVIPVPHDIAETFIEGTDRRVICHIKDLSPFRCGLMPHSKGGYCILLNKKRREKIESQNPSIEVSIEKDTSELGMDTSPEFLEVLDQYIDAQDLFNQLTPGKKRTLIYWSDNVKSPEIKIRRAIVMCRHLIAQNGSIDFKLLNEEIKVENAKYKRQ